MDKIFCLVKLGAKYLYRYKRRYAFLFSALIFGFGTVTFITSQKDGMLDNVYYSAQSHYAGDIVAEVYMSRIRQHLEENEISAIINAANAAGINPIHTVKRTINFTSGILFYQGNTVRLKYLVGSDWENETHIISRMDFVEPPSFAAGGFFGDDGIIISSSVADQLGAKTGDIVLLEADTQHGQKNTADFIVRGIIRDNSIFGYHKAYISRPTLNRLTLFGDNGSSVVGFFLDNTNNADMNRELLHRELSKHLPVADLFRNGDELADVQNQFRDERRIFLYTVPVYLSEIADLMNAINIITYLLYGMMLLIIFVSAAVTYRLILHERTKDVGIMRALGFYGQDIRLLLWAEIIILGLASLFAGFILALLANKALSLLSFEWFPSFEIFMRNGRLVPLYLPETVFFNVLFIFAILVIIVLAPSFRASRKKLPELLSGDPL